MPRIKPYILAGGKSSRMGRDKAMLELEGRTLLSRAVEMLRSVKRLQSQDGSVEVTICGAREALEGADRAIVDRSPDCGPLAGIEAALSDLECRDDAEWAFFIPVDTPLLSATLIGHLLAVWTNEALVKSSVRACMIELEGRAQPLVSLIHRSVHTLAQRALEAGDYKVVPVLQSAGAYCTSLDQEMRGADQEVSAGVFLDSNRKTGRETQWNEGPRETPPMIETHEQFMNVNIEADLIRVATLLRQKGSNR